MNHIKITLKRTYVVEDEEKKSYITSDDALSSFIKLGKDEFM
jgi:hypothetical protein